MVSLPGTKIAQLHYPTFVLGSGDLLTVKGSPMSQRHIPFGWRRATSMAYTDICSGNITFHFHSVCISAMSPVWTICSMLKSKTVFVAAEGASSCLSASPALYFARLIQKDRFRVVDAKDRVNIPLSHGPLEKAADFFGTVCRHFMLPRYLGTAGTIKFS